MKVGVFGAGAIGASLGIRLSAAGVPVRMLARPSLCQVADDLVLHTIEGRRVRPGPDLVLGADPTVLHDVDMCLVTVKSRDTIGAARTLLDVLPGHATVVSFQNGLRNPDRLRAELGPRVSGGMVSYNVVRPQPAVFRQATKGPLVAGRLPGARGDDLRRLADAFEAGGDHLALRDDIEHVMAGKLLLNLNNGVCAVTGVTIAESVRSRTLRRCFALLIREGIAVMRRAGLRPRSIVGLSPSVIGRLLGLPDAIVLRAAKSLVAIDPQAKSSTLQDLEAGKPTEIDDICGEIVRLADEHGGRARCNRTIVDGVHALEQQDDKRWWSPEELLRRLSAR
jgi:2-dehydropantoate 2-reductase